MAKSKFTPQEINQSIAAFCEVTFECYSSHSFSSGFLSQMLQRCVEDLPRHKQAEILECLKICTDKYNTTLAALA